MAAELDITPTAGCLGARISGLDASDIDEGVAAQLTKALIDHHVIFMPGLAPTPAQLRRIASLYGPVDAHPYLPKADPDIPEVDILDSSATPAADIWHTDMTFVAEPPLAALLHMVEGPDYGGDTMWINCHAVYDTLSAPMQAFLEGLTCIHDDASQGDRKAEHPVIRVHPETQRKSLYVNKQFSRRIPQLSRPESQNLLAWLFRWQEQVAFSCRWSWSNGDVVLWDERVTLHSVVHDQRKRRVLHRCSVLGDRPQAPDSAPSWPRHQRDKMASSGYYGFGGYEF